MEGIIFIGIQASGKSTFYKENFFNSHLRISLDLLNTRNKERQILDKCLDLQQRVVIDNTNPTAFDRKRYIDKFKARKYNVIGYYFETNLEQALARNEQRTGKARISDIGVRSTYKKLQIPDWEEGFDQLFKVQIEQEKMLITAFPASAKPTDD